MTVQRNHCTPRLQSTRMNFILPGFGLNSQCFYFPMASVTLPGMLPNNNLENVSICMRLHLKKRIKQNFECTQVLITMLLSSQLHPAWAAYGNKDSMWALIQSCREAVGENFGTQTWHTDASLHLFNTHSRCSADMLPQVRPQLTVHGTHPPPELNH